MILSTPLSRVSIRARSSPSLLSPPRPSGIGSRPRVARCPAACRALSPLRDTTSGIPSRPEHEMRPRTVANSPTIEVDGADQTVHVDRDVPLWVLRDVKRHIGLREPAASLDIVR